MSSFFVAMKGYRQRFQGHFSALCRFFPKKHLLLPLAQGVGLAMGTCPGVYWRMSGSCFLCQEGCANNPTSRQASWNTSNRLVPVVCHQLFCFTFCVVMCKHVLLQIIFCSCVIRTTFSREKWQIASLKWLKYENKLGDRLSPCLPDQLFAWAFGFCQQLICSPLTNQDLLLNLVQ